MGKKNNIVFNLTIDDLKELGIIKSKRRRKRKIELCDIYNLIILNQHQII